VSDDDAAYQLLDQVGLGQPGHKAGCIGEPDILADHCLLPLSSNKAG
jgi:hypothetical protein